MKEKVKGSRRYLNDPVIENVIRLSLEGVVKRRIFVLLQPAMLKDDLCQSWHIF